MAIKMMVDSIVYDIEYGDPSPVKERDVRWRQRITLVDDDGQRYSLGELLSNASGEVVRVVTAISAKRIEGGSVRDLVRDWVRLAEIRQCYECGTFAGEDFGGWTSREVDLDPGNPEVGPQPNVQEVDFCSTCSRENA